MSFETGTKTQWPKAAAPSAHGFPAASALEYLRTDPKRGLSRTEASARRETFGKNELRPGQKEKLAKKLFRQINEAVIWLLLGAGAISGFLGDWTDTLVIFGIVLVNGIIGFVQEEKAGEAIEALRKLTRPTAKILRDGAWHEVPASELVPGDLVDLGEGDAVPADCRLVESHELRVDESSLTGESIPVEKDASLVLETETPLADRRNMVFSGTHSVAGSAKAVVVATGMETEMGRISGMLSAVPQEATPLQKRIAQFSKYLVLICLGLIVVVFGIHLLRGGEILEVFLLAVSLAVAAVPEGLPAVVTVALAMGMKRMVKRKSLIRTLPSVETLGSVTVICSDKTGTLTYNRMTVREVFDGTELLALDGAGATRARGILEAGARCSTARLKKAGDGWEGLGDPTEVAILRAFAERGGDPEDHRPIHKEVPFDSKKKYMLRALKNGATIDACLKGAPEVTLEKCSHVRVGDQVQPLTEERKRTIRQANEKMANQSLRVLGVARAEGPPSADPERLSFTFLGLIGMMDPPSEEAKRAVEECARAGIRPVMITGDHPSTALAIGRELGIVRAGQKVLTGGEIEKMDEAALDAALADTAVYARVSPQHKLRIVKAWKRKNAVVAMTGDGINDAPALTAADIGIAMGRGTDVTKQAADVVLTDDNFRTIVDAVEEGRGILDNIQKVIHYLLAGNTSEILVMFLAAAFGWPYPLVATHILWVNLVTDGLPGLALVMDPIERGIMDRPPRPVEEPIVSKRLAAIISVQGLAIAVAVLSAFSLVYQGRAENLSEARTVAFSTLVFSHLMLAFNCRSFRVPLWKLGFFTNPRLFGAIFGSVLFQGLILITPALQSLFEVTPHATARDWKLIFLLGAAPFLVNEAWKGVWFLARFGAWRTNKK